MPDQHYNTGDGLTSVSHRGETTAAVVYVVHGPKGFTETFDLRTVNALLLMGLIRHERDGFALEDGDGNGVGPLHRYYCEANRP